MINTVPCDRVIGPEGLDAGMCKQKKPRSKQMWGDRGRMLKFETWRDGWGKEGFQIWRIYKVYRV